MQGSLLMAITERFSNGDTRQQVRTTGDIIEELLHFPLETPVSGYDTPELHLILFEAHSDKACISFEGRG